MSYSSFEQTTNRFGRKYNFSQASDADTECRVQPHLPFPQGQIVKLSQSLEGSQNGFRFAADMIGAVNINTGECSGTIVLHDSDNPAGLALGPIILWTYKCSFIVVPKGGAQNLSDIVSGTSYKRRLIYQFLSGEKLVLETEADLTSHSGRTRVSGTYPTYLDGEVAKDPLITLAEPAAMKMVNAETGVTYSGRMKLLVNGKIVPVDVTSEYVFKGTRLKQEQVITFENGSTLYSLQNGIVNQFAKVGIHPAACFKGFGGGSFSGGGAGGSW